MRELLAEQHTQVNHMIEQIHNLQMRVVQLEEWMVQLNQQTPGYNLSIFGEDLQ